MFLVALIFLSFLTVMVGGYFMKKFFKKSTRNFIHLMIICGFVMTIVMSVLIENGIAKVGMAFVIAMLLFVTIATVNFAFTAIKKHMGGDYESFTLGLAVLTFTTFALEKIAGCAKEIEALKNFVSNYWDGVPDGPITIALLVALLVYVYTNRDILFRVANDPIPIGAEVDYDDTHGEKASGVISYIDSETFVIDDGIPEHKKEFSLKRLKYVKVRRQNP